MLLNLEALRRAPLVREPFNFTVVKDLVRPADAAAIRADFPVIENSGLSPVEATRYGPWFAELIKELRSEEAARAFFEKFGVNLVGRPQMITMRGRCAAKDGRIHTDTPTKLITVLIYFNEPWEAKGGRLRVEYRKGVLLVADGASLIQYDPDARTAQRTRLRTAAADMPMLYILLNPGALAGYYEVRPAGGDTLTLEPRRQDLPRVELTGRGNLLQRIQWTDATGARQVIQLQDPHIPAAPFAASEFTFQAPAGTRWLGR